MKRPCLLTLPDLLAPVKRAHDKVDSITRAQVEISHFARSASDKTLSEIANEGIFVLLMSTFEVMLSDILVHYLQEFPEKMDFKATPFTTDQVLGATMATDLWRVKAESLVRSTMFQNMNAVVTYFLKTLSIDDCPLDHDQLDKLRELKESRNLLLHADLIVNAIYRNKAESAARSQKDGERIPIDDVYLGESLVTIKFFLLEFARRLSDKYSSYTRLAALKRLWNYMLADPRITPFEDYWHIDQDADVIRPRHNPEAEQRMGSSERLFLALWRDSLNGTTLSYSDERLSMTCLDRESVAKVGVFLSASRRFGVIAN
jgi:hypothetical protein